MSSPSQPQAAEGVVRRGGEVTGPVRLPAEDRQRFIDTFNHLYRTTGLSVAATPSPLEPAPATEPNDEPADRDR